MGATNREVELQQELRQLHMLLDRSQFEKNRMQRAHDPLTAKYDALKKDIRQTSPSSAMGLPPGAHTRTTGTVLSATGANGWGAAPDVVAHTQVPHAPFLGHHMLSVAPGR